VNYKFDFPWFIPFPLSLFADSHGKNATVTLQVEAWDFSFRKLPQGKGSNLQCVLLSYSHYVYQWDGCAEKRKVVRSEYKFCRDLKVRSSTSIRISINLNVETVPTYKFEPEMTEFTRPPVEEGPTSPPGTPTFVSDEYVIERASFEAMCQTFYRNTPSSGYPFGLDQAMERLRERYLLKYGLSEMPSGQYSDVTYPLGSVDGWNQAKICFRPS
jgi:hypothetical protein